MTVQKNIFHEALAVMLGFTAAAVVSLPLLGAIMSVDMRINPPDDPVGPGPVPLGVGLLSAFFAATAAMLFYAVRLTAVNLKWSSKRELVIGALTYCGIWTTFGLVVTRSVTASELTKIGLTIITCGITYCVFFLVHQWAARIRGAQHGMVGAN